MIGEHLQEIMMKNSIIIGLSLLFLMSCKKRQKISGIGNVPEDLYNNEFGECFNNYTGSEAVKKLIKEKRGYCPNALYREDIGYIDIIWGEVTDYVKHTGYGLSHIIDKHENDIKLLGFNIENFIPFVIEYGIFNPKKSNTKRRVYENSFFRFVIKLDDKHSRQWILTAFDLKKKKR